jgi:AAA domain-containing protein
MKDPLVVWIIGAPGAGKTTLVRKLLSPYRLAHIIKPKWTVAMNPKNALERPFVAAGHYTGKTFDGADTIAYNGAFAAYQYWLEKLSSADVTLLDGDRFSSTNALHWWQSCGARTRCIYLQASDELLDDRCLQRGSKQNAAWRKGRATKAARHTLHFQTNHRQIIDASWPLEAQVSAVLDFLKD